ncbi:MAG: hypothetical protein Q7R35_00135 [Elusimicrobiota bacterium]|nr:hypothetical protein [Elusimicrobiota bacterium]
MKNILILFFFVFTAVTPVALTAGTQRLTTEELGELTKPPPPPVDPPKPDNPK